MSFTMIKAQMFPPFSISIRKCVFIFHEQHNHGWNVPPLFTQRARYMHFLHHHGLYDPTNFDNPEVRIYISWAAQSWLTYFCHFLLSGSAYLYFMNSTIMADLFPRIFYLFLTLRQCVIILILFATSSSLTCFTHFRLSGSGYQYFMSSTIMADIFPPLSISGSA